MIKINNCTKNDIPLIIQLGIRTFCETFEEVTSESDLQKYLIKAFNHKQIETEFSNWDSEFYLIKNNDIACGYMKLNYNNAQQEFKEPDGMELARIYILERFKAKGIGKKAIEFCFNKANYLSKKYIWLGVWESNFQAIRFYEKYGFKKIGEHVFQVGNDSQKDILMKKNISNHSKQS